MRKANRADTEGITANSIAAPLAPAIPITRRYSVVAVIELSSTMSTSTMAPRTGSETVAPNRATRTPAGTAATVIPTAFPARGSTSRQNRCWYTPPRAMPVSPRSVKPMPAPAWASAGTVDQHAVTTAASPSTAASARRGVSASRSTSRATTVVTAGFTPMMSAATPAGTPACRPR
ncbi:hypothetical protein VPH29_13090 [Tsukamurella tyrosinosolvens]|nr:hypothetical protein [Tsukamurella tyrosinosolvens]MEC4614129.1 hypothetical protein [Tsukamurella tyrosinosolvens]